MEELKRLVAHTTRAVDELNTPLGLFIENRVEPSLVRLFREQGIKIYETTGRVSSQRPGAELDVDMLAITDADVFVIEVKERVSHQTVEDFLGKLRRFKQSFPRYAAYDIYGAVAGIEIDEGVDRFAYQRGLFPMSPYSPRVEFHGMRTAKLLTSSPSPPTGQLKFSRPTRAKPPKTFCTASTTAPKWGG